MSQLLLRKLIRGSSDVVWAPWGELLATTWSHEEGGFCEAFSENLTPLWTSRLESCAETRMVCADDVVWVLDSRGLVAFCKRDYRIDLLSLAGMHPARFAKILDGFIVAWHHDVSGDCLPPVVRRYDNNGVMVWSTTLSFQNNLRYPGKPRSWLAISPLLISGDSILATFGEMVGNGIGLGYVLSRSDGTLRYTTRRGPIHEVGALGEGAFLVGYQGYGEFETLRYDRDGNVADRWPSHGYYIVDDTGLRVIEMKNELPSRMRVAWLLPGGRVKKGSRLEGYYTSRPYVAHDGTVYVFRDGALLQIKGLQIATRRQIFAADDRSWYSNVVGNGDSLFVIRNSGNVTCQESVLARVEL